MTRVLKFRRGTTAEHESFTGAEGEVTVNTDKDCLIVHDGLIVGGIEHVNLNSTQRLTNKDIDATGLNVSGVSTFVSATNFNNDIDVDGHTELDNLNVSGVSTFAGSIDSNGPVEVGLGVTITSNGINVTGVITATSFVGDGSNLSNTGSTLSASSGTERVVLTNLTSGTMTASSTNSNLVYNTQTNTLFATNVSIAGTLTYEDVTNIDSIGIITARSDVIVGGGLSVTGISTLGNTVVGGATTELVVNGSLFATSINGIFGVYGETVNNIGNTGTSATINLQNGTFVIATLTGNCTFTFVANNLGSSATSFTLLLTNDGTAGRSIVWPASVKWPNGVVPVRTTTANKTDVYTFFTYDGGTNWWGQLSLYNYS